jgi:branched-chain amino acid transport system substrate-binding protein
MGKDMEMVMARMQQSGQANRRSFLAKAGALAAAMALTGCSTVLPSGGGTAAPSTPTETIHKVAILVPLSGPNADIGISIANAATMGFIDTQAATVRMTSYDTALGADVAAQRALADGNRLILGPLLSDDVVKVAGYARPAGVPIISFSNDVGSAGTGVFLMGQLPSQSVERVVSYAFAKGKRRFAALVPNTVYGQRATSSLQGSMRMLGGTLVGIEVYDRTSESAAAAAKRLQAKGAYDALLIADNGRAAMMVAPLVRKHGGKNAQILGVELWNTESELANNAALRGAWYASISDTLYPQFSGRYKTRFGKDPYRLSTLGYDAALLTVRVSKDWAFGTPFPMGRLTDADGFAGLDGTFRFLNDGRSERMLEISQVNAGGFAVVDAAPAAFAK